MDFLAFSAEAKAPAGFILMNMINPVKKMFNNRFSVKNYCVDLDDIFIVFICTSNEMKQNGVYKERKYVSHKNRYADLRLHIDYEQFLTATNAERLAIIWNVICRALNYIHGKVPSLNFDELMCDIKTCMMELYSEFCP